MLPCTREDWATQIPRGGTLGCHFPYLTTLHMRANLFAMKSSSEEGVREPYCLLACSAWRHTSRVEGLVSYQEAIQGHAFVLIKFVNQKCL